MSSLSASPEGMGSVNPDHIGLLNDTLRAPSAHNAQPWQVRPLDDGKTYEIHYDQSPDLPRDYDEKDAYLTMGAFVETMVLQAPNHGYQAAVTPELSRDGQDLFIARVAVSDLVEGAPVDPLSQWVGQRATNRHRYERDPLPTELEDKLRALGNVLVDPKSLEPVVLDASVKSWADPTYVRDLQEWFRKDEGAKDGLTARILHLGKVGTLALDLAFRRGSIRSAMLGKVYSSTEVSMFASAPRAAVLSSPDLTPESLFEAGRRLLRSWVVINAAGYSYQPYSVAVDERSTVPQVAEVAGVEYPVSLYRIGKSRKPARPSNRRPLEEVIVP